MKKSHALCTLTLGTVWPPCGQRALRMDEFKKTALKKGRKKTRRGALFWYFHPCSLLWVCELFFFSFLICRCTFLWELQYCSWIFFFFFLRVCLHVFSACLELVLVLIWTIGIGVILKLLKDNSTQRSLPVLKGHSRFFFFFFGHAEIVKRSEILAGNF